MGTLEHARAVDVRFMAFYSCLPHVSPRTPPSPLPPATTWGAHSVFLVPRPRTSAVARISSSGSEYAAFKRGFSYIGSYYSKGEGYYLLHGRLRLLAIG